ncbi:MAG: GrpB family protein [Chloroflexia bacterium]|nr:GrpB family protein [Chloroflexia bacterium]
MQGPETDLNFHVWLLVLPEVDRHRSLRDWLRTHPDDLEPYERTKRGLAARNWDKVQQYADAKTAVVEAIQARSIGAGQNCDTNG